MFCINQLLEQPKGSYYLGYETFAWFLELTGWIKTMTTTWMKCFNHWAPKPSKIMGSLPSLQKLRRIYSAQRWDARKATLMKALAARPMKQRHFGKATAMKWWLKRKIHKSVKTVYKSKGGWTCGSKHLSSSSGYTWLFCDTVVQQWEEDYKMQTKGKHTFKANFTFEDLMVKMPFGLVHGPPAPMDLTPPKTTKPKAKKIQSNLASPKRVF